MRRNPIPLILTFIVSTAAAIAVVELLDRNAREETVVHASGGGPSDVPERRDPGPDPGPDAGQPPKPKADPIPDGGIRVVLVSVDGFRTDLVQRMPNFRAMLKHGSWTLRATTTVPSITTAAHASMFTGMPPTEHGVAAGAPSDPSMLKRWAPLKVRTIFQDLDRDRYRPAAFVQKEKLFRLMPDSAFVVKVLDRAKRESKIVHDACAEIGKKDGSRMIVIHFKRFDAVGHSNGWMSPEQLDAAGPMDEALLGVSACIAEAQRTGQEPFALIVTADHGGSGHDHDTRRETDMRIPWLVIGPGVKEDHEIRRAIFVWDTAAVIRYFLGYGDRMHEDINGRFPYEILER